MNRTYRSVTLAGLAFLLLLGVVADAHCACG